MAPNKVCREEATWCRVKTSSSTLDTQSSITQSPSGWPNPPCLHLFSLPVLCIVAPHLQGQRREMPAGGAEAGRERAALAQAQGRTGLQGSRQPPVLLGAWCSLACLQAGRQGRQQAGCDKDGCWAPPPKCVQAGPKRHPPCRRAARHAATGGKRCVPCTLNTPPPCAHLDQQVGPEP